MAACGWWYLQAKTQLPDPFQEPLGANSLVIQAFLFHLYCTGNRFFLPLKALGVSNLPMKSSCFSVPVMLAQGSMVTRCLGFFLPLPLSPLDVKVFPDCLPDQSSLVTIDDVLGLVAPGQPDSMFDLNSSTDGTVLPVDAMMLVKCWKMLVRSSGTNDDEVLNCC